MVISDPLSYPKLKDALSDLPIEVALGADEIASAAALPEVDVVVTAMVGYSGLLPTVAAIKAGENYSFWQIRRLSVVAGEIITGMLKESKSEIVPVDSEHSAIFQCLVGERNLKQEKILLTASGGPFRKFSAEMLEKVTVADALNHPNWQMGAKVTIDSASMMNKGF